MSRPPAETSAATALPVLDAMVMAHGGLTWAGEFNDVPFARLADVALSDQPALAVTLRFALVEGRPMIRGELKGELTLRCQRCWQPMQQPLHESFDLMVIESEDELERVPESLEPWVANAHRLEVHALVEEQLLLALPLIAKHEHCVELAPGPVPRVSRRQAAPAAERQAAADDSVQRPFGNLRDLLGK